MKEDGWVNRTREVEFANWYWRDCPIKQKQYLFLAFGGLGYDSTAAMFISGGKVGGPFTALSAFRPVPLDRNNLVRMNLSTCMPNGYLDEPEFVEMEMSQEERDAIIDEIMRDRT